MRNRGTTSKLLMSVAVIGTLIGCGVPRSDLPDNPGGAVKSTSTATLVHWKKPTGGSYPTLRGDDISIRGRYFGTASLCEIGRQDHLYNDHFVRHRQYIRTRHSVGNLPHSSGTRNLVLCAKVCGRGGILGIFFESRRISVS